MDRLVQKVAKSHYFVPFHRGFRQGCSTMDSVLKLVIDIKKVIANKEVVVAVFLDIEKANDAVEGWVIDSSVR